MSKNIFGAVFSFVSAVIRFMVPPKRWRVPVIMALGIFVGIGVYVLNVSNATSYLSDDPKTCINCHVMTTQYVTWERSSHARVAKCTDCHVPHDNIIHKYWFKANDGLRHSAIFTMHGEPQVIFMKEAGVKVVQENCIRCHYDLIDDLSIHQVTYEMVKKGEGRLCWDCHRETPHGRVRSLSAVPHARVPELPSTVPQWFQETFLSHQDDDDEN